MLNFLLMQCDEKDACKIEYIYHNFHDDLIILTKEKLKRDGIKNYESEAEDIVQNLYMRLIQYIYNIDMSWSKERIKSYVMRSLNNSITDYYLMLKKIPSILHLNEELIDEIREEDFLSKIKVSERYEEVVDAISRLEPIYRVPLTYRFVDNMEVIKIAEIMEIPQKTVYTRIERGKRFLLAVLEEIK